MKVFVMHDDQGKIGATFASQRRNVGARAMAGMKLHVFDHEELEGEELKTYLRNLHSTFRVASGPESSTLEKRKRS